MKSAILIVLVMIMHFTKAQNGLQASYDLSTQTKDDHLTVNQFSSFKVSEVESQLLFAGPSRRSLDFDICYLWWYRRSCLCLQQQMACFQPKTDDC